MINGALQWDDYAPEEAAPIFEIGKQWLKARADKDYVTADHLRTQLLDAGVLLDTVSDEGLAFSPMGESESHRFARLNARDKSDFWARWKTRVQVMDGIPANVLLEPAIAA